jgi:hypothetical protein
MATKQPNSGVRSVALGDPCVSFIPESSLGQYQIKIQAQLLRVGRFGEGFLQDN